VCWCVCAESVVRETCRLSSGAFMVRYVTDDTHFSLDHGNHYLIRKGDRIAVYPPTIHMDPEIFVEPKVGVALVLQCQIMNFGRWCEMVIKC
jgi:cytochrome P450